MTMTGARTRASLARLSKLQNSWQEIDADPENIKIASWKGGGSLYKLRSNGEIHRREQNMWVMIDNNPQTKDIVCDAESTLCQPVPASASPFSHQRNQVEPVAISGIG
jgi:hypothetical protein